MPPRLIQDYPDWDPGTGKDVPRPSRSAPSGSPRQGIPIREINPDTDVNLGGGSRMIGRTPTYKHGGVVKAQGGGFMGSVAQGFQQGFGGDMPVKKKKKGGGDTNAGTSNSGSSPDVPAAQDDTPGTSASDPASGAAAGETYRRGGKVKHGSPSSHYCKGGKVISSRNF